MTNCAKFDDLPQWFHADLLTREDAGDVYETTYLGRRWCINGVIAIAVHGPTWAIGNIGEGVFNWTDVRSPTRDLVPMAPVAYDVGAGRMIESLASHHPDLVRYVVPMGHDIYVALGLYLLVADAFGDRLRWFGTSPTSPVVAHVDGDLVAIVMPVRWVKTNKTSETKES